MKLQLWWWSQEARETRNMENLLREAAGSEQSQTQQGHRIKAALVLGKSYSADMSPGY